VVIATPIRVVDPIAGEGLDLRVEPFADSGCAKRTRVGPTGVHTLDC